MSCQNDKYLLKFVVNNRCRRKGKIRDKLLRHQNTTIRTKTSPTRFSFEIYNKFREYLNTSRKCYKNTRDKVVCLPAINIRCSSTRTKCILYSVRIMIVVPAFSMALKCKSIKQRY